MGLGLMGWVEDNGVDGVSGVGAMGWWGAMGWGWWR